jgi:transposase-like protein
VGRGRLATAAPARAAAELAGVHGKGIRGRGAAGKGPVVGLLKRRGRVYTVMIPNLRSATLMPIMPRMIVPDRIVHTDSSSSHHPLDDSAFHPRRIHHGEGFAVGETHINGIETFWSGTCGGSTASRARASSCSSRRSSGASAAATTATCSTN